MNKYLIITIIILSACLVALGFNTIEWMTQKNQDPIWYFIYPLKFGLPFWWAYFLGGILPLSGGSLLIGILIGYILKRRKRRVVTA